MQQPPASDRYDAFLAHYVDVEEKHLRRWQEEVALFLSRSAMFTIRRLSVGEPWLSQWETPFTRLRKEFFAQGASQVARFSVGEAGFDCRAASVEPSLVHAAQ